MKTATELFCSALALLSAMQAVGQSNLPAMNIPLATPNVTNDSVIGIQNGMYVKRFSLSSIVGSGGVNVLPGQSISIATNGNTATVSLSGTLTNSTTGNAATATTATTATAATSAATSTYSLLSAAVEGLLTNNTTGAADTATNLAPGASVTASSVVATNFYPGVTNAMLESDATGRATPATTNQVRAYLGIGGTTTGSNVLSDSWSWIAPPSGGTGTDTNAVRISSGVSTNQSLYGAPSLAQGVNVGARRSRRCKSTRSAT